MVVLPTPLFVVLTWKDFDPMRSFGDDTAAGYDDFLRGDEAETVACLEKLARGGPVLERAGLLRLGSGSRACRA